MEPRRELRQAGARRSASRITSRLLDGYVADEDVAGLFARSDVVALPYRSAMGSAVLGQAAVCRRPVVATRVGPLPAMVGDRGVLVPPDDPAALADGLVRALRDPPPPPRLDDGRLGGWSRLRARASAAPRTIAPQRMIMAARRLGIEDGLRDVHALRSHDGAARPARHAQPAAPDGAVARRGRLLRRRRRECRRRPARHGRLRSSWRTPGVRAAARARRAARRATSPHVDVRNAAVSDRAGEATSTASRDARRAAA